MSFIAGAIGTKVAIAALALVAVGGGTAAAAATVSLPSDPKHGTSPSTPSSGHAAHPSDDPTAEPTAVPTPAPTGAHGPDATGAAAFGLCTAYAAGGLDSRSVAYAALLSAAGSASIADYCAPVLSSHHQPTTPSTSQGASHRSEHAQNSGALASHRP